MKNEYVVCGDVTEIILRRRSGERVVTLIDTADLDRADSFPGSWYLRVAKNTLRYAQGQYWIGPRDITRIHLHRVIADAPAGLFVDHKNNNGLDNRRQNLRIVSYSVNSLNRSGLDANNQSGFRGVSWSGNRQKFRAVLTVDGHRRWFGHHDTAEDAARAVYAALVEIDPVAALNYPTIPDVAV